MKLQHFQEHKRKYIGFAIVAILVFLVTYVVYQTEALTQPPRRGGPRAMMSQDGPCSPFQERHFRFFFFLEPCVSSSQDQQPSVPVIQPETPTASTTPVVSTSTASSTETTIATSTDDTSSSTSPSPEVSTSTEGE